MMFRSFLEYYENEMNYLVESGKDLKKYYPSISNLDFSNESNDPDVKKLIEGTAFLNASLQKRIDEKNIELSQEILNSIYPHFNRSIPSFSIFQLKNLRNQTVIQKFSKIKSSNKYNSEYFNFLTTHKMNISAFTIQTIEKTNVEDLPKYISKLTNSSIKISLNKIFENPEKEMILYINAMDNTAGLIYDSLFSFYNNKNTPVFENNEQIGEVEFYDDFKILPTLKNENTAYESVIDFNLLKEKFLFFKIKFNKTPQKNIQIPIKNTNDLKITEQTFLLNCVIGVNLIEKLSDPIQINQEKHRYKLFFKPNEDIYSIYEIQNIKDPSQQFIHYFSLDFCNKKENDVLWYYKKDHNIDTSTFLYFYDEKLEHKTIFAKMLCMQKQANELIPINEEWTLNQNIECINVKKPTKYQSNSNHYPAQRKIISLLNLNHFGLENHNVLQNIKALFEIFSNNKEYIYHLNNIKHIDFSTQMVPLNGMMVPKIFVKITVEFNPLSLLTCRILSKLIASTVNMNKKIGITLIKNENNSIWKEWDIK